ncbi:hypothetical protein M3S04_16795 [Xanthomonas sp. PPL139]|uniref:hypothetical protein n=1 Tax=unclassified Xanthomonas TaxID=2643310 RepID=UPI00339E5FC5
MKRHGDPLSDLAVEAVRPVAMAEVTLCADPGEPRAIAQCLPDCAEEMERMGADYDHLHLSDRIAQFETAPQFVVAAATVG